MTKYLSRPVFMAALLLSLMPTPKVLARGDDYDASRKLVQRVQDDLQALHPAGPHQSKDSQRIQDALKHLSDLDRSLSKGKFSKSAVSDAIGDAQGILNHNTLEPRERDMLTADVRDLKELKVHRGR